MNKDEVIFECANCGYRSNNYQEFRTIYSDSGFISLCNHCSNGTPYLGDVLDKAKDIINGSRQGMYGVPEDSCGRVNDYWDVYIKHKNNKPLIKEDIPLMMALFKLARLEHSYTEDSVVDMLGYIAMYNYIKKDKDARRSQSRGINQSTENSN